MDKRFYFEEIHVKALLKILNLLTQEFFQTKTTKSTPKGKGRPPTKVAAKPVVNHISIEFIDITNKQQIIDSILNIIQYFDQYFKYNYKYIINKTDTKTNKIKNWLKHYYKRDILVNIDFDVIVREVVADIKPNLIVKDTNSCTDGTANGDNSGELVTSDVIDLMDDDCDEVYDTVPEIDDELKEEIVYNLELILLLVAIIFIKVRNLFPKLFDYLEFAWIYLQDFENRLEEQIQIENLIELLQNEFISQRNANKMRSEVLNNEIIQLNAMVENLEKQYEDETRELIYLQNATIIGHNSASGHSRQLSKIMNLKAGPSREQKIYTCPECGKTFKNGYKLNRHQYVHKPDTDKPYSCDWPGCGYRSIANNDLSRHRMIHTGEKPYTCDVDGCDRRYSRPDKLSYHKRMAHKKDPLDKKFACDWPGCGYRTVSNSDLARHNYIHTGERPFKCDFVGCDKAFSRPDKLRHHKEKSGHNPEEPTTPTVEPTSDRPSAITITECVPQAMQWT